LTVSSIQKTPPASELIGSKNKNLISDSQFVFDNLPKKSTPVENRFKEVKEVIELQKIEMIRGVEEASKIEQKIFSDVKEVLCVFADKNAPFLIARNDLYDESYHQMKERGIRILFLTDITKENDVCCKHMISEHGVVLRHSEDPINGCLLVADERQLMARPAINDSGITLALYSNAIELAEQYQQLFNSQWKRAIAAAERMSELEEGSVRYRTRIIRDPFETLSQIKRIVESSNRYSVSSVSGGLPFVYKQSFEPFCMVLDKFRRGEHGGVRWVTTIDAGAVEAAKKFLELGMSIRHIVNAPPESFGLSEKEVGVTVSKLEGGKLNGSALFSDDPDYVVHYASLFEELWASGIDAKLRIKEIEEGIIEPKISVIRNQDQIQQKYLELINHANKEIMLILPTTNAYLREVQIGVMDALRSAASERGIKVSMLAPDPSWKLDVERFNFDQGAKVGGNPISHKVIREATTPNTVTVLVVDRTSSLIIEQQDDSKLDFNEAIGVATYSTRGSTVKANIRFFERMWEEEILLEKERRSRRQAELLQDILTHDIRNFHQVTKLSAELIQEELEGRAEIQTLVQSLVQSIDASSQLLDRAKKLGKAISEENPTLYPVDLTHTMQNTLAIVKNAHPEKRITDRMDFLSEVPIQINDVHVQADDLIDDVFLNLYSNSVKYTEGQEVFVETSVRQVKDAELSSHSYWEVTVTDKGRGIPDEVKAKIFSRYLEIAKGSGLGMSIVQALVVDRYRGKVQVRDRVEGDYHQGTSVDIWLPEANSIH
jgi:signal transduction histidine kinase